MTDIRLKTKPYDYNGKTYMLRCNFNVLADVQEEYGAIPDFKKGSMKKIAFLMASMMNDYADEMNWSERVTAKEIGRTLDIHNSALMSDILELFTSALYIEAEEEDSSKN